MEAAEECAKTLETLASHEAAIADFYKSCAGLAGAEAELWMKLAAEEDAHAALLREVKGALGDAPDAPFPSNASCRIIAESQTRFIRKEIERLKGKKGYSIADALRAARRIEASFFETSVFDALSESGSPALQDAAKRLLQETGLHSEALEACARRQEESAEKRAPEAEKGSEEGDELV